jgi:hypothetical protein
MARSVTKALVVPCILDEWDEAGEEMVWIKQARGREDLMRDVLYSKVAIERQDDLGGGMVRELYELSGRELVRKECFLTFVDATFTLEEEDPTTKVATKRKLFKPGMSEADFNREFGELDPALIDEWHFHVREVNPQWNPRRQAALAKN